MSYKIKIRNPRYEAADELRPLYRRTVKEVEDGIKTVCDKFQKFSKTPGELDVSKYNNGEFVSKFGIMQRYAATVSKNKTQKATVTETFWHKYCEVINQISMAYDKNRFKLEDDIAARIDRLELIHEDNERKVQQINQKVLEILKNKTAQQKENEKYVFGFFERGEKNISEMNKQLKVYSDELGKTNSEIEELKKEIGNETREENKVYASLRDKMIQLLCSGELDKIQNAGEKVNNSLRNMQSQKTLFDEATKKAKKMFFDAGIIKGTLVKNDWTHCEKHFENIKTAYVNYVKNGDKAEISKIEDYTSKLIKWIDRIYTAVEQENAQKENKNLLAVAKQIVFAAATGANLAMKKINDKDQLSREFEVDKDKVEQVANSVLSRSSLTQKENDALKSFFKLAVINNNKENILVSIQNMIEVVKETRNDLTDTIKVITSKAKDMVGVVTGGVKLLATITLSVLSFPPDLRNVFADGLALYSSVKTLICAARKK
jgi:hypothetical protein